MGVWAHGINGERDCNKCLMRPWHLPLADTAAAAGHPGKAYSEWIGHQARDADRNRINHGQRHADVMIPVLHWGDWYDVFLNGTIGGWEGVCAEAAARGGGTALLPAPRGSGPMATPVSRKRAAGHQARALPRIGRAREPLQT